MTVSISIAPIATEAAIFNVADGDVTGLVAAINAANTNGEADVINLAPNGTYVVTAVNGSETPPGLGMPVSTGLPVVEDDLVINGNGSTVERDAAAPSFAILANSADVFDQFTTELNDLTIRGGTDYGIFGSYLILNTCQIIENSGDGMRIGASLSVSNSRVERNTQAGILCTVTTFELVGSVVCENGSGGIHLTNSSASRSVIDGSTICNNGFQGVTINGNADVTNSTISGNASEGITFGGALALYEIVLTHCTVVANNYGVRNQNPGQEIILSNTIVADSQVGDCETSSGGIVTDGGYNLIEDGSCLTAATSISGDPLLGPLTDNGGPTPTHALLQGSPAIDAGDCDGGTITTDQRAFARPSGGACDIGAVESGASVSVESATWGRIKSLFR